MKSKLLAYLSAAALGMQPMQPLPTPAMAFGAAEIRSAALVVVECISAAAALVGGRRRWNAFWRRRPGGGMHFGGTPSRGMVMGRSAFVPGAGRFAGVPFAGQRFGVNRFNNFAFRRNAFFFRNRFFFRHHHHFRNFAFVGAGFGLGLWPYYGYGGCWQQVWTGYGYQWVNVCNDYGYGY